MLISSAQLELLEYNILSIVVQRDDGAHILPVEEVLQWYELENLGAPSDGGLIAVVGVFIERNRKVIACINAMGKLVFNENQRWKEQPHHQYIHYHLLHMMMIRKRTAMVLKKSNKNDNNNKKKNKFDKYNKREKERNQI